MNTFQTFQKIIQTVLKITKLSITLAGHPEILQTFKLSYHAETFRIYKNFPDSNAITILTFFDLCRLYSLKTGEDITVPSTLITSCTGSWLSQYPWLVMNSVIPLHSKKNGTMTETVFPSSEVSSEVVTLCFYIAFLFSKVNKARKKLNIFFLI